MSKAIKSIASIALPIALNYFAPGIGSAIGGSILGAGAAGSATLGGALLGAGIGAATGGGLKGALMGAAGGALGPNIGDIASNTIGGTQVGNMLGVTNPATAGMNATGLPSNNIVQPSIGGAVSPGAAVASSGAASGGGSFSNLSALLGVGNALMSGSQADAATEASKIQSKAIDKAVTVQAPYNELGTNAAAQIKQIQADPGGYVQNNPFYKSLADDAQQRLLANQAAKGKVGSGGTASALQDQLLQLGNGLVQQQVGTLQNQVNSGQLSANTVSDLQASRGDAAASGVIGRNNAMQTGYNNQINTLLALQSLNKQPAYAPNQTIRA